MNARIHRRQFLKSAALASVGWQFWVNRDPFGSRTPMGNWIWPSALPAAAGALSARWRAPDCDVEEYRLNQLQKPSAARGATGTGGRAARCERQTRW